MTTVDDLVAGHRRLALDSSLFIYLFEAGGWQARTCSALLDAAEVAGTTLIVSALTLAELAVGPAMLQDEAMADRYRDAIRSIRLLDIVPLSADIAVDAGLLRGRTGCSLADAIHLATALQAGATAFVTNDRRLHHLPKLEVVQLAELVTP
jgi:predicted nucleic acid-binding protein